MPGPRRHPRAFDPLEHEDQGETRDEFARDVDRVFYSSALRRLGGVTQVADVRNTYVFHDRLTHSLKVAQVASAIAVDIGGAVDPRVAQVAGLVHDIGHPPFGHAAEREIMAILDGQRTWPHEITELGEPPVLRDSFEGNAQSFRIVAKTAARKFAERGWGLNLTLRSLAAASKYPWVRGDAPGDYAAISDEKWGAYDSEQALLIRSLEIAEADGVMGSHRSVEADIMDWADDVSYATHDIEDFFRAGRIPLHELQRDEDLLAEFRLFALEAIKNRKVQDWVFTEADFDRRLEAILARLPSNAYVGDFASREEVHAFGSEMIRTLTHGLVRDPRGDLLVPTEKRLTVEILKKLTKFFVVDRPEMYAVQRGQARIVRSLFFEFYIVAAASLTSGVASKQLPPRLFDYLQLSLTDESDCYEQSSSRVARAVTDFVSSLTDRQAEAAARTFQSGDVEGFSIARIP